MPCQGRRSSSYIRAAFLSCHRKIDLYWQFPFDSSRLFSAKSGREHFNFPRDLGMFVFPEFCRLQFYTKLGREHFNFPRDLETVTKESTSRKKRLPKQTSTNSNTNTKCSFWTSDLSRPALLLLLQNREVPSALDNSLRVRAKHPHYPTSPITKKMEEEKTPITKKKEEEKTPTIKKKEEEKKITITITSSRNASHTLTPTAIIRAVWMETMKDVQQIWEKIWGLRWFFLSSKNIHQIHQKCLLTFSHPQPSLDV